MSYMFLAEEINSEFRRLLPEPELIAGTDLLHDGLNKITRNLQKIENPPASQVAEPKAGE